MFLIDHVGSSVSHFMTAHHNYARSSTRYSSSSSLTVILMRQHTSVFSSHRRSQDTMSLSSGRVHPPSRGLLGSSPTLKLGDERGSQEDLRSSGE